MKRKIEYFDSKADYWQNNGRETEEILAAEIFENHAKELTGDILDLGCGTGFLFPFIKKHSNEKSNLYCADISVQMLNKLLENNSDCNIVRCDAHNLPFDNSSLSMVFCYNTFPHFENKKKIISEIKRVLKKDGMVFIMHNMNHRKLNDMHTEKGEEVSGDEMLPVYQLEKIFLQHSFLIKHAEEKENRYLLIAQN